MAISYFARLLYTSYINLVGLDANQKGLSSGRCHGRYSRTESWFALLQHKKGKKHQPLQESTTYICVFHLDTLEIYLAEAIYNIAIKRVLSASHEKKSTRHILQRKEIKRKNQVSTHKLYHKYTHKFNSYLIIYANFLRFRQLDKCQNTSHMLNHCLGLLFYLPLKFCRSNLSYASVRDS